MRSENLNRLHNHNDGNIERVGIESSKLANLIIGESKNITGRIMNDAKDNLEKAIDDYEKAKMVIFKASKELNEQLEGQSKKAKESVSRAKDAAAQMTDAMNKITKVLGPDFEKRISQLQLLTECLERLQKLNEGGKLAGMISAISK